MKEFLQNYLQKNPNSFIRSADQVYTYFQFLKMVEEQSRKLCEIVPYKAKCVIFCREELNTALLLCSCFFADKIPIVVSYHYGEQQCNNIINFIKPDILLTDEHDDFEIELVRDFSNYSKQEMDWIDQEIQDVSIIMCTSGTTGIPKGVMHTSEGIQKNVLAIANYFKIDNQDTILISRPLYHCAALTGEFLTGIYSGSNIVFCNQIFSPIEIIKKSIEYNVTVLGTTPTMVRNLSNFVQRGNYNLKIRTFAVSGECLNRTTANRVRETFPDTNIYNVYGLTEAGPRVSYLPCELFDEYCESVGIPLNGIKVKIVNQDFNEVSDGSSGLVMVNSPSVMKGYYRNKELSDTVLKQDGWLVTGDIGYFDERGFLYICSRADDMIIKGGMNIYPQEIENLLTQVQEIKECVAYGEYKNDTQTIILDVVLHEKYKSISEKEIMKIVSKQLPSYQMPSKIHIVNELEKGPTGKVKRRKLG